MYKFLLFVLMALVLQNTVVSRGSVVAPGIDCDGHDSKYTCWLSGKHGAKIHAKFQSCAVTFCTKHERGSRYIGCNDLMLYSCMGTDVFGDFDVSEESISEKSKFINNRLNHCRQNVFNWDKKYETCIAAIRLNLKILSAIPCEFYNRLGIKELVSGRQCVKPR